jgi:cytochrome oxidase Cu insertion factor (SCO1/SenC/PrrC family)
VEVVGSLTPMSLTFLLAMAMGPSANFPARYLDELLTYRSEIALLIAGLIAGGWYLYRWKHSIGPQLVDSKPRTPAPNQGSLDIGRSSGQPSAGKGTLWQRRQLSARSEPLVRKILRISFAAIWILDGLLQAQSAMPREFIPMVVEPALSGQPQWLVHFDRLTINLWSLHTVSTDAFTVFIQVAIGILILADVDGELGRLGLAMSIAWGLIVWVLGEGLGDIFGRGATVLTGAPGAVMLYVAAAVLLLNVPPTHKAWSDGRVAKGIAYGLGIFWLAGAVLQSLPYEGFWKGTALAGIFESNAQMPQPSVIADPISAMGHLAAHNPVVINAIVVGAMALLGIGLLTGKARMGWLGASGVWLFAIWWLGMDFGVVGGTGTDPNLGVLFIFIAAAWAGLRPASEPALSQATEALTSESLAGEPLVAPEAQEAPPPGAKPRLGWLALRNWVTAAAAFATVWTAIPVIAAIPKAASIPTSESLALAASGGLASIPGRPMAPNFHLVNQYGKPVSLSQYRGKVVLLSFLDPVCYATCPVVADELAQVAYLLSSRARNIQFVTVNANPDFTAPSNLASFDQEHHIAGLDNWTYVTGTPEQLKAVWKAYGAPTLLPRVGMAAHSLLLYIIGPHGREVDVMQATGTPGLKIEQSYAELFADQAASLLPAHAS